VVYHQDQSQVSLTRSLLGLSESEAQLLSILSAGQALWRVGSRSFVVQHYRSRLEANMTNTDTGMAIPGTVGMRG
jgi:hypothetical protein